MLEALHLAKPMNGKPAIHHDRRFEVPAAPISRIILRRAIDIESKPLAWLWPGRILQGELNSIEGPPDVGKSLVFADVVARVTTGRAMPFENKSQPAANVLICCVEDSWSTVHRPRLDAAGANLSRVFDGANVIVGERERLLQLPDDISILESVIVQNQIRLVVFNTLAAFLNPSLDANSDADCRQALVPLRAMAERTGCSNLFVRHHSKTVGANAMNKGAGSVGISGQFRSVLSIGKDKDGNRVLASVKCNLAVKPESISFTIEDVKGQPKIAWLGASDVSADDMVANKPPRPSKRYDKLLAMLRTNPDGLTVKAYRYETGANFKDAQTLFMRAENEGYARKDPPADEYSEPRYLPTEKLLRASGAKCQTP